MTVRCMALACFAATEDVDCCCVLSCKEEEEEDEDSTQVFVEKAPVYFFLFFLVQIGDRGIGTGGNRTGEQSGKW